MRVAGLVACSAWLAAKTHAAVFEEAHRHGQVVLGGLETSDGAATRPKNIVFILSDDQDLAMDSVSYMPLLHKHLAEQGTTFTNHFTTTAVCCPSRVSLWTGKQPHNTNVTDVNPPYGTSSPLPASARASAVGLHLLTPQLSQEGIQSLYRRA